MSWQVRGRVFFLYVLRSELGARYYVGSSKDVSRRLAQRNSGMTKATRGNRPWRLVYAEAYGTLAEARRRERQIKSWKSRSYMERVLGLVK